MPSAKEAMVNIIAQQPEDSSYDEILRELAYARMVERGLADSDAGRTVANSEVRSRIDSWQKSCGHWRRQTALSKSTSTFHATTPTPLTKSSPEFTIRFKCSAGNPGSASDTKRSWTGRYARCSTVTIGSPTSSKPTLMSRYSGFFTAQWISNVI